MATRTERLLLDDTHGRQLQSALRYVLGIHHHVDPDFCDIDADVLRALAERLAEGDNACTLDDWFLLEMALTTAEAYSSRQGFDPVEGVAKEDFTALLAALRDLRARLTAGTGTA